MKVLVTDPIADAGLDVFRDTGHDVVTNYDAEGEELLDAVADSSPPRSRTPPSCAGG